MDFQTVRTMMSDPTKMDEVWELACEMDDCASEVFKDKDAEYIKDFVNIVRSAALTYLVSSGKMRMLDAAAMAFDDDITEYLALCIKGAIGLAILEELR